MKWVALVAAALAFAGPAAATVSPAYIAQQTKQVYNRHMAFLKSKERVLKVRCQPETAVDWFCVITWRHPGSGPVDIDYHVHLAKETGILTWKANAV